MGEEQIFLACLSAVAALAVFGVYSLFIRGDADRVKDRLQGAQQDLPEPTARPSAAVPGVLTRVGEAAAKPFEPKTDHERSALRQRLGCAGIYSPAAARLWVGAKILLLGAGLVGGYLLAAVCGMQPRLLLLAAVAVGILGYLLPVFWLSFKTKRQQRALEHALPDALDLMVICVESGLTMDSAMHRVGREITMAHPALARELAIAHMEMQMGVARIEAMRSMAQRTGSPSVKSLTAMLIQADRFGTSIANALRVYSESLRIKRQHKAEEMAAKTTVKMAFPLVLCVFPAILMVVGAPAAIRLMETFRNMQR